jgi:hypothetical protein
VVSVVVVVVSVGAVDVGVEVVVEFVWWLKSGAPPRMA